MPPKKQHANSSRQTRKSSAENSNKTDKSSNKENSNSEENSNTNRRNSEGNSNSRGAKRSRSGVLQKQETYNNVGIPKGNPRKKLLKKSKKNLHGPTYDEVESAYVSNEKFVHRPHVE